MVAGGCALNLFLGLFFFKGHPNWTHDMRHFHFFGIICLCITSILSAETKNMSQNYNYCRLKILNIKKSSSDL